LHGHTGKPDMPILNRKVFMAKAKNKVIAGDYTGMVVGAAALTPYIITGFVKSFNLDKQTVESYEVITDEHRKIAASGVARGIVGGVLLGPVGMLAGGLSAKSKFKSLPFACLGFLLNIIYLNFFDVSYSSLWFHFYFELS